MDAEPDKCPACGEAIKSGVFGTNKLLLPEQIAIINEYHTPRATHYCEKCGDQLSRKYHGTIRDERTVLVNTIEHAIEFVPIVSVHSPLNWDYSIRGIITAQSTTGTGVVSEICASFTDFFGAQSESYNKKIADGEMLCMKILRMKAINLECNAIIASDIDYADVGGDKGMLMVCMTGTAVVLNNSAILGEDASKAFTAIRDAQSRHNHLAQYQIATSY